MIYEHGIRLFFCENAYRGTNENDGFLTKSIPFDDKKQCIRLAKALLFYGIGRSFVSLNSTYGAHIFRFCFLKGFVLAATLASVVQSYR